MFGEVANHIYRRAVEDGAGNELQLPWWTALVILFDVLLFLPVWIIVGYTLQNVIPTLAMIEDEDPPAYEPVALDPALLLDSPSATEAGRFPGKVDSDGSPRVVTSSLRASLRLIRSQGRFRAYLRGLPAFAFYGVALGWASGFMSLLLPRGLAPLAALPATLALVQVRAAWVHSVVTPHSNLPFWRRMPPFKRTLRATARPTALVWFVSVVGSLVPLCAISLLDVRFEVGTAASPSPSASLVSSDRSLAWKAPVVALAVLVQIFLVIPADVVLTRVIASLLPEDQETIVPFDRSFGGAVEPAVVTGKGYPTMAQAWSTFPPTAWRRLVTMYVKLFAISVGVGIAMAAVIIPEVFLVLSQSKQVQQA